jgi:hydroxymethylbilane synthase
VKVRIATRASKLALIQARTIAQGIREHNPGVEVEEVEISTKGDRVQDRPLNAIGGKSLFVAEVEAALVNGEADIAVHSLKDVPGDVELAEGFDLICVPERGDPHDVLVTSDGRELDALEAGARVGTTSLRRMSQLRALRPDLNYQTLRGNVITRLSKLDDGRFSAIVLAAAGLERLGLLGERAHRVLSPETCVPSIGQGTLAVEGRKDDDKLREILAPLEHDPTRLVTEAERAFLRRLEGSCHVPIAGMARLNPDGNRLSFEGLVGSIEGEEILQGGGDRYLTDRDFAGKRRTAHDLGVEVADGLLQRGARRLIQQAEASVQRRQHQGNGGSGKWS